MLTIVSHLAVLAAGGVAGAFAWPHVSTLWASWSASKAVTAAKALIAKAEADAKALEAAKAVVAAAPAPVVAKPVATGATGATGA